MIITFSPDLRSSTRRWISRLVLCPLYRKRRLVEQSDWLFSNKWQGDSVPPGPFSPFLWLSLWPGGHTLDFILRAPQPLASSWGQPREGTGSKREKGCVTTPPPWEGIILTVAAFLCWSHNSFPTTLIKTKKKTKKKKQLGFSQLLLRKREGNGESLLRPQDPFQGPVCPDPVSRLQRWSPWLAHQQRLLALADPRTFLSPAHSSINLNGSLKPPLMPDDVKWNWCNNRNKVYNKCAWIFSKPSFLPRSVGKSSMQPVLDAKKVGDHCYTSSSLHPLQWTSLRYHSFACLDLNPKSLATNKGQGRGRAGNKILMEQIPFSRPKWPFSFMTLVRRWWGG